MKIAAAVKVKNACIQVCGSCEALLSEINDNENLDIEGQRQDPAAIGRRQEGHGGHLGPLQASNVGDELGVRGAQVAEGGRRQVRDVLGRCLREVAVALGGSGGRDEAVAGDEELLARIGDDLSELAGPRVAGDRRCV